MNAWMPVLTSTEIVGKLGSLIVKASIGFGEAVGPNPKRAGGFSILNTISVQICLSPLPKDGRNMLASSFPAWISQNFHPRGMLKSRCQSSWGLLVAMALFLSAFGI